MDEKGQMLEELLTIFNVSTETPWTDVKLGQNCTKLWLNGTNITESCASDVTSPKRSHLLLPVKYIILIAVLIALFILIIVALVLIWKFARPKDKGDKGKNKDSESQLFEKRKQKKTAADKICVCCATKSSYSEEQTNIHMNSTKNGASNKGSNWLNSDSPGAAATQPDDNQGQWGGPSAPPESPNRNQQQPNKLRLPPILTSGLNHPVIRNVPVVRVAPENVRPLPRQ